MPGQHTALVAVVSAASMCAAWPAPPAACVSCWGQEQHGCWEPAAGACRGAEHHV